MKRIIHLIRTKYVVFNYSFLQTPCYNCEYMWVIYFSYVRVKEIAEILTFL